MPIDYTRLRGLTVREMQTMMPEELEAEGKTLAEYVAQRAKELGYDTLTGDDIVRIIHEHRAEQQLFSTTISLDNVS